MTLLLDTHTFLWFWWADPQLSATAAAAICDPANRKLIMRKPTWSESKPDGRWRSYDYEDILKRDKVNLDIFWLRDQSLEDSDDLPAPYILAQEIADDLQTALEQFSAIAEKVKG